MLINATQDPSKTKLVEVNVELKSDFNGMDRNLFKTNWYKTSDGKRDYTESEVKEQILSAYILSLQTIQRVLAEEKTQLIIERLRTDE